MIGFSPGCPCCTCCNGDFQNDEWDVDLSAVHFANGWCDNCAVFTNIFTFAAIPPFSQIGTICAWRHGGTDPSAWVIGGFCPNSNTVCSFGEEPDEPIVGLAMVLYLGPPDKIKDQEQLNLGISGQVDYGYDAGPCELVLDIMAAFAPAGAPRLSLVARYVLPLADTNNPTLGVTIDMPLVQSLAFPWQTDNCIDTSTGFVGVVLGKACGQPTWPNTIPITPH